MRAGHALHNAKDNYPNFEAGSEVMTPYSIMYHLANMIYWADSQLNGTKFEMLEKIEWSDLKESFFEALEVIDKTIDDTADLDEKKLYSLYQGPLNDAMTHIGQLNTLRRLSGDPISRVNYMKVDIQHGKFDYTEFYH